MKKLIIILIIVEILISGIIILLKDSIIIGNYNEYSTVYNIVSSKKDLPKDAIIKYIIKNRFVYRDITYSVYYKTDKMYSTNIRLESTNSYIQKLDSYAVGIEWYCILLIFFTITIFYIMKKIKKNNH